MSGAVKRQHEDAAITLNCEMAAMEGFSMAENGMDGRPAKVARHDSRDGEKRFVDSLALKLSGIDGQATPCLDVHMATDAWEGRDLKGEKMEGRESRELRADLREARAERDLRAEGKNQDLRGDVNADNSRDLRTEGRHVRATQAKLEDARAPQEELGDSTNWPSRNGRKVSLEAGGGGSQEGCGDNKTEASRDERENDNDKDRKDEKDWVREERRDVKLHMGVVEESQSEEAEKEKEAPREKPKEKKREEKQGMKRDRDERDAGKAAVAVDANGALEDYEMGSKHEIDAEDHKPGEKEKDRAKDKDREKVAGEDKKRDKEEMFLEGEAGGDKDKEPSGNNGVQQKKRLLRPRGHLHTSTASRSRFRPKEPEGWHGRSEISVIHYRIGEGMPELAKVRNEFLASLAGKNVDSASSGPTIEIRIPAALATTSNKQVRGSQLWGTDIYTDDSDIVAVLMHTGYYSATSLPVQDLRATIRVLPPQDCYTSTLRNNLRSRAWGAANICSYSVERCRMMKSGGGFIDLEPCLGRPPSITPTLSIPAAERTVTTRAASSSSYRQQRYVQEVTVQYNLCNEPWLKYNMSYVTDKGLKKAQYTSARLKGGDVLYVETHSVRYELSYEGESTVGFTTATSAPNTSHTAIEKGKEKGQNAEKGSHAFNCDRNQSNAGSVVNTEKTGGHTHGGHQNGEVYERYKWSRCKKPLPLDMMQAKGMPLPSSFVEVLESGLHWEDIQWSQTGVWIRDKEYALARAQFLSSNFEDSH